MSTINDIPKDPPPPKPSVEAIGDPELAQYRNLLQTPTEFKDGFGWSTIAGVIFCGLIMMPGSIYLGLMTGGGMGAAAQWVTVILFAEIMRRSLKNPSKQELVVLLWAAGAMATGGAFSSLVFRAYFANSEPVRDALLRNEFPNWWVPSADSAAITGRNLFHSDWILPIALLAATTVLGFITKWTLGYFFFRLTSDIEQLPFPMAPISAQGAMAMAEADEPAKSTSTGDQLVNLKPELRKKSDRWRLFTLGVLGGVLFGTLQVGIPAITGLLFDKPLFLLPQPWWDWTTFTQGLLPATPTGMIIDPGIVLIGMIIPFWAVIGTMLAILVTILANPILHHAGILTRWQPGMDTINTSFANGVDFYISFGIGIGLGIAVVSIFQTIRDVRKKVRENKARRSSAPQEKRASLWETPQKGRGDFPLWISLVGYIFAATATVVLCHYLLPPNLPLRIFLIIFAFVYSPIISYVNARLMGISGQSVDIPFVRETTFILSGAKGVGIWLAPIPIENYGGMAQQFRVNELTGVNFMSLLKTDLVVIPTSFILSFIFWAFIWASDPIPSSAFPAAQVQWELASKNMALLYSSTHTPPGQMETSIADSQFMQAIHPGFIGSGFALTVGLFALLSGFGLPVMLVYGMIRGFGGLPHTMMLELVGALIGRYYFQKRFGPDNFLRMIPTILAGYYTGVGLIGMGTIAMRFIQSAISSAPF